MGLLGAPEQREVVRSWPRPGAFGGIVEAAEELAAEAAALLGNASASPVETSVAFDARYVGQGHELTVSDLESFHDEHRRRNGYARPSAPIEVLAVRGRAWRRSPVDVLDLPVPSRPGARGPAVLAETDCTIWVPPGWEAVPGDAGALVLRRCRPR